MINPHEGYCDFYGFATKKENDRILNVYLSKMDILNSFTLNFKEQAASLIRHAENSKIILPNHSDALDFIDSYSTNEFNLHRIKLSKRQLECARLIMQGKTTKEIAIKINLSLRTIESYINTLKSKLGCRNKAELIIKLINNLK